MKTKDKLKKERAESKFYNGPEIEFNINDLAPSKFKDMLSYYDVTTHSPTEYLLTSLLVALSGVIGKRAFYGPEKTKIYLNIYALVIGPSGYMRKSTAMKRVMYDIEKKQKELNEKYSKEYDENESSTDKTKPPNKEYIRLPSDVTAEKLAEILATQQRGLIVLNEFAGWLKRLQSSYQLGAKELFTELYDVPESHNIARKTSKDIYIEDPFISLIGASTIEWLQDSLHNSDQASGFLARFIVSIRNRNDKDYVPISQMGNKINSAPLFDTGEVFNRLYGLEETILHRTKDAEAILTAFEFELKDEQDSGKLEDNESSFVERLKYYTHKFAGIIALVNSRPTIQKEDAEDAVTIAKYYRENITRLLNSELLGNIYTRKQEKVFNMIKNAGKDGITQTKLLQNTKYGSKVITAICDELDEQERILIETIEGKTKPVKRYFIIEDN
jgi:hypothetical protein